MNAQTDAPDLELVDYFLEVDGEMFGASLPEPGNAAQEPPIHPGSALTELTLGVRAIDADRLARLVGRVATLRDLDYRTAGHVQIEKALPELSALVVRVLPEA